MGSASPMIEEIEEGGQGVDTPTAGNPTGFASIRDQIREERDAIAAKRTLDLLVPGYSGNLIGVRYRAISAREVEEFVERQRGEGEQGIKAGLDLLIACCDSILYRAAEDEEFEPALDDDGDKIRFDVRLAEAFDIEATSARETVSGFFSPEGAQPFAVGQHIAAVQQWLAGESSAIDPALLGN